MKWIFLSRCFLIIVRKYGNVDTHVFTSISRSKICWIYKLNFRLVMSYYKRVSKTRTMYILENTNCTYCFIQFHIVLHLSFCTTTYNVQALRNKFLRGCESSSRSLHKGTSIQIRDCWMLNGILGNRYWVLRKRFPFI